MWFNAYVGGEKVNKVQNGGQPTKKNAVHLFESI